jgi:glutathione synthase/RimK-type ligase-like ATP-grasp enzyme
VKIGIFGSDDDLQCHAVAAALSELGADNVLLRSDAFEAGLPISFEDDRTFYRGTQVDDLLGFYLRFIPAPYAPYLEQDGELRLYADWFHRYMQSRERASFFVAWLLRLQRRGAVLVNPPHAASVLQYKPFQLDVLRSVGAQVPRTLISNDPARVRAFRDEVKDVIYKPVMGGALTRALDDEALEQLPAITSSPVIFQSRAPGDDLRIMLVGEDIVSSVAIVTPEQQLDFRGDDVYSSGNAQYREVQLPEQVKDHCRKAARALDLAFAGIDIKHHGDDWVFLELNSSPIYLDVERKLGHPISAAIARYLVDRANGR